MNPPKEEIQKILQALRDRASTEEFKLFLRYLEVSFQYRLPTLLSAQDANDMWRLQGELKTYSRMIVELTRPDVSSKEGVLQ